MEVNLSIIEPAAGVGEFMCLASFDNAPDTPIKFFSPSVDDIGKKLAIYIEGKMSEKEEILLG